jgi:hypothetical protein
MTGTGTAAPTRAGEQEGQQDARGRFMKGNQVAVKHLAHVAQDRWPGWLSAEVRDFYLASLTDDGGESEITARRKAALQYRSRLHGLILGVGAALEHHGLMDRRGRLREGWIRRLESLIGTARSLDATLGYSRHQRDVGSLADYINAEPETAPQTAQEPAWGESGPDREELDAPQTDAPTEAQNTET